MCLFYIENRTILELFHLYLVVKYLISMIFYGFYTRITSTSVNPFFIIVSPFLKFVCLMYNFFNFKSIIIF